jgi:hypothetical protein
MHMMMMSVRLDHSFIVYEEKQHFKLSLATFHPINSQPNNVMCLMLQSKKHFSQHFQIQFDEQIRLNETINPQIAIKPHH